MAGEKAAIKAANIATQNLKGIGNLATKVGKVFTGGDPQANQGQGQPEGQGQVEDFVHVMDNALMTSCSKAMKIQSLVSNVEINKILKYKRIVHSPVVDFICFDVLFRYFVSMGLS